MVPIVQFNQAEDKVVLFSGGADSTALMQMMHEQGIDFMALHFNHHLRAEESNADEAWCQNFCAERKIEFVSVNLYVREDMQRGETEESAARRMRLEYLQEHYIEKALYLAHHADDVDETFLMRMMRGAGASGLSSLREERDLGGLKLIRPLLDWDRSDLHEYLIERQLSWREDATNADADYCLRNKIRHEVLPQLKELGTGLRSTQKLLAQAADFLESEARRHLDESGFTREMFLTIHGALKQRVLRLWFEQNGNYSIPSSNAVERLEQEWQDLPERAATVPLGHGVFVTLWSDSTITFGKEVQDQWQSTSWTWLEKPTISIGEFIFSTGPLSDELGAEVFAKKDFPKELLIQPNFPGAKLIPFGKKSPRKVSDFISMASIPASERKAWPLVTKGEEIIWIPGVKRAEFGRTLNDEETIRLAYARL
jgi:tRNA(Ile)-lysidine synthase